MNMKMSKDEFVKMMSSKLCDDCSDDDSKIHDISKKIEKYAKSLGVEGIIGICLINDREDFVKLSSGVSRVEAIGLSSILSVAANRGHQ